MSERFIAVDKNILPASIEKVLKVNRLLKSGKVKEVTKAIQMVGISRSSYYKYKNCVIDFEETLKGKKAIISLMLEHETGNLLSIIEIISSYLYNIWTINQNPPINGMANVVISIDISENIAALDEMIEDIRLSNGVGEINLIGVE